ncbi:MAG TPA: hypothetical protein VFH44_09680, partial [Solirubrobacterales bacterium]|nr:hypothetical protein [Solirubrobacterales bacterium]
MVSCASEFEATVVRMPGRRPTGIAAVRLGPARLQPVRTGASVEIPHAEVLRPRDGINVAVWVWLAPGAPRRERCALLASWGGDGA